MDWTRAMEALAGFGPLENAAGELEQIAADEERAMDARIAALIELVELGERARAAKLACALLGRLVESADVARAVVVTELLTSALRAAARSARLGGVTGQPPQAVAPAREVTHHGSRGRAVGAQRLPGSSRQMSQASPSRHRRCPVAFRLAQMLRTANPAAKSPNASSRSFVDRA